MSGGTIGNPLSQTSQAVSDTAEAVGQGAQNLATGIHNTISRWSPSSSAADVGAPPPPPNPGQIEMGEIQSQLSYENQLKAVATLFTGGSGVMGQPKVRTASSLLLGS